MQLRRRRDATPAADWQARVEAAHGRLVRGGHQGPIVAVSTPAGRFAAGDVDLRAEIGSVTKLFTALLLARMAEAGMVRLGDRVADLLPPDTPLGPGVDRITLESLACHRSGLPRLPPGVMRAALRRGGMTDPYAHLDERALLKALATTRTRGEPGQAAMRYSNFGAGLLGHLLGRVAGCGYGPALVEHVLSPLGIAAQTDLTDRDLRQGHAGHRPVPAWHLAELAGAGGLRAPATDLLTYLETVRSGEGPLGDAIAETLRPRGGRAAVQVGLGWLQLGDGDLLMHNGGTHGARSEVRVERHSGTCVVVLGDGRRGTAPAATSLLDPQGR
jgi:CubicO group peptidase (beta-lactamase class C family)